MTNWDINEREPKPDGKTDHTCGELLGDWKLRTAVFKAKSRYMPAVDGIDRIARGYGIYSVTFLALDQCANKRSLR